MQYTRLGRTGLKVRRLSLGTLNFGWLTDEADSHVMTDRAVELGINFFDTADVYGGLGGTESIVGRWLSQGGGRRNPTIIGPRRVEQLDACTKAFDVSLDDDVMQQLDKIWPGPGGEAPDAWDVA